MKKTRPNSQLTGATLFEDFKQALISMAYVQHAKYSAENSEQTVLNELNVQAGGRILMPDAIPVDTRDALTRASIDAHIKKIQATQMESAGITQVGQLQGNAVANYTNRKITITVLQPQLQPVDVIWFSPQTGYKTNPSNKRKISGVISEVLLEKNVLVIKPTYVAKLINSKLYGYSVGIVNPETFEPMVSITLL